MWMIVGLSPTARSRKPDFCAHVPVERKFRNQSEHKNNNHRFKRRQATGKDAVYDRIIKNCFTVIDGKICFSPQFSDSSIQSCHHNDTRQQVSHLQFYMNQSCQDADQRPCQQRHRQVSRGFTPLLIKTAVTATPIGKLPSTVRSVKIQNFIRDIHAESYDTVNHALFQCARLMCNATILPISVSTYSALMQVKYSAPPLLLLDVQLETNRLCDCCIYIEFRTGADFILHFFRLAFAFQYLGSHRSVCFPSLIKSIPSWKLWQPFFHLPNSHLEEDRNLLAFIWCMREIRLQSLYNCINSVRLAPQSAF